MFQDVDYEISSVVEACRCMTSDKIIERRRAAELLQKLFSNESYIIRLDLNTDTNLGFTWNDVFEAAVNHFKKVTKDQLWFRIQFYSLAELRFLLYFLSLGKCVTL